MQNLTNIPVRVWGATKELTALLWDTVNDSPYILRCAYMSSLAMLRRDRKPTMVCKKSHILNVFVHGYLHDKSGWADFEERFTKESLGSILSITLSKSSGDIRQSAEEVDRLIEKVLKETNATEVNFIAHSMGGIVTSYLNENLPHSYSVRKVVTLGTPLAGTKTAFVGIGEAARQMEHESPFLKELTTKMRKNAKTAYYCAAGSRDQIVKPYQSCLLYGSEENGRQKVIRGIGHAGLLFNRPLQDWVVSVIRSA